MSDASTHTHAHLWISYSIFGGKEFSNVLQRNGKQIKTKQNNQDCFKERPTNNTNAVRSDAQA